MGQKKEESGSKVHLIVASILLLTLFMSVNTGGRQMIQSVTMNDALCTWNGQGFLSLTKDSPCILSEIRGTLLEYEIRPTMKMYRFQFVSYYSVCFYVAFFKGKCGCCLNAYTYMFGDLRNEEVWNFFE
ncbi:anoctamin-5 [Hemicordylus capensis]|uniref:anoctamin-5 n=1 Tax=Hemicordylus capensis TaxID=884348 RepID=UPI002304B3D2|nr:anoctamin-5 [Hemicordylus capensis]